MLTFQKIPNPTESLESRSYTLDPLWIQIRIYVYIFKCFFKGGIRIKFKTLVECRLFLKIDL